MPPDIIDELYSAFKDAFDLSYLISRRPLTSEEIGKGRLLSLYFTTRLMTLPPKIQMNILSLSDYNRVFIDIMIAFGENGGTKYFYSYDGKTAEVLITGSLEIFDEFGDKISFTKYNTQVEALEHLLRSGNWVIRPPPLKKYTENPTIDYGELCNIARIASGSGPGRIERARQSILSELSNAGVEDLRSLTTCVRSYLRPKIYRLLKRGELDIPKMIIANTIASHALHTTEFSRAYEENPPLQGEPKILRNLSRLPSKAKSLALLTSQTMKRIETPTMVGMPGRGGVEIFKKTRRGIKPWILVEYEQQEEDL